MRKITFLARGLVGMDLFGRRERNEGRRNGGGRNESSDFAGRQCTVHRSVRDVSRLRYGFCQFVDEVCRKYEGRGRQGLSQESEAVLIFPRKPCDGLEMSKKCRIFATDFLKQGEKTEKQI